MQPGSAKNEETEETSDQFHILADTMTQLAGIGRADGYVECGNRQWYDYTGSTPEQTRGNNWIQFIHPDDQAEILKLWHIAVQTGKGYEKECRIRESKTGKYRWFLNRTIPYTDEQGRVLKWFSTSTDIHERKLAEEALRESRDTFRLLIEAMPQLVWIAQPDGQDEYANQRWYDYIGSTAEQMTGENWISYYHPEDQEKLLALWHASLLTSQPFQMEARLREDKTGEYRWFLIRAIPLVNTYGRVWKWFGTNTDIHEKKCSEEALRESEVRFRRLVQSNIIGITITDLEGNFREANEAFLAMLGYIQKDLAAGRLNWIAMTPPEHQARSAQAREEMLATGTFTPFEKEYITKDGKRVPVLIGGAIFHQGSSQPLEICFTLDITDRKEIERQKDLFLGMTGHELKAPLAALKGTLQLVQRRLKRVVTTAHDLSPEMDTFFGDLTKNLMNSVRQIDVQTRLINDLLDVSRITTNTLKLSKQRYDLGEILRETVGDLQVIAPNRSLLLEVPEHAAVHVLADRDRISQVVTNYVTNALRYSSPNQPIHIGLDIQEEVARVWVRDKGPGLSEKAQKEIWQRFHQIKEVPVQSGSGKGLGLGLYICQMLVAQHQGEVGVESTPGEGSTFWFTLPIVT